MQLTRTEKREAIAALRRAKERGSGASTVQTYADGCAHRRLPSRRRQVAALFHLQNGSDLGRVAARKVVARARWTCRPSNEDHTRRPSETSAHHPARESLLRRRMDSSRAVDRRSNERHRATRRSKTRGEVR